MVKIKIKVKAKMYKVLHNEHINEARVGIFDRNKMRVKKKNPKVFGDPANRSNITDKITNVDVGYLVEFGIGKRPASSFLVEPINANIDIIRNQAQANLVKQMQKVGRGRGSKISIPQILQSIMKKAEHIVRTDGFNDGRNIDTKQLHDSVSSKLIKSSTKDD